MVDLEGRLVLHTWANVHFVYASMWDQLSDLERADEDFDGGGWSGDDDLLTLKPFRGMPILTPDGFLSDMPEQKSEQEA